MAYSTASKAGMVNNSAREAQRQYQREWRRANPQKVREYNERYWEKKATATVNQTAQKMYKEEV